jgi:hypothetical protein
MERAMKNRLPTCFGWMGIGLLLPGFLLAAVTGKISGKIIDRDSRDPLPGANVMLIGTPYGAAADARGEFFIINLPPGRYTLEASMIGYSKVQIENVTVSTNATTTLYFELPQTVIQGEVVVVTVDALSMKKDQTSSVRHVSSETISSLPVEDLQSVVQMQTGVIEGHFRGGRMNEVSYMIDGLQVNDVFNKDNTQTEVENEVIQDVEIISGTFNAEYGRAMSGIVNAVTKDGGNRFRGSASAQFGNYYTPSDDVFMGLKPGDITRKTNFRFNLAGPVIRNHVFFLLNARIRDEKNHLNGVHRFNAFDYSDFTSSNPSEWYTEHSGSGETVPMGTYQGYSLYATIAWLRES